MVIVGLMCPGWLTGVAVEKGRKTIVVVCKYNFAIYCLTVCSLKLILNHVTLTSLR